MGTRTGLTMGIRQRLAGIASLMLLATILPEMLSGNTPLAMMAQPPVFFFYLFAYGLPVLVIREFGVRNGMGLAGLFLLGLGYGIINEALFAKTVFLQTGVPVDVYDGYGYVSGIQWAWAGFILPWHAVASTILPIAFAHFVVPGAAAQPWLGKRITLGLTLLLIILISVFYLYEETSPLPRSPLMLTLLWSAIAMLAFAARQVPSRRIQAPVTFSKLKQVALGFNGIVPFLSLLVVAHVRWPYVAYFAVISGWIALYHFLVRKFADTALPAFGWFGLGWYMQIGVFSWLGIAMQKPMIVAVDIAVFAVLWWILRRAERISA